MYNENVRDLDVAQLKHMHEFGRTTSEIDHPWKLTDKRVEDSWSLYALVCFYRDRCQLDEIDFATTSLPSKEGFGYAMWSGMGAYLSNNKPLDTP